MCVLGIGVDCFSSYWWRAGWLLWRWWRWGSPRSALGFHVTACIIRYGARGSALVEIGAMVFICLQYASWLPLDFCILHTRPSMCKTATVLKLSKRRKKYEKYELILAKYLTLIFLSTFPSIFMLAESSALPSAGKRSDAAWKWYFINI